MAMPGRLEMIEAVRAYHSAYERGDWDAALSFLQPDFEYVAVEFGVLSGTHRGHAGMRATMAEWLRAWERDSIRFTAHRLVVAERQVIVYCTHRARGHTSGLDVALPLMQIWTFGEDGRGERLVTGSPEAVEVTLPGNVEALIRADDARQRGDVQGALAVLAEDVEWHGLAHGPLAGPFRGHEGVLRFHREWDATWEEHERRLELLIEDRERVITQSVQRRRSRGLPVERVDTGCWWFRDGEVVRVRFFDSLQEALSARD